jgi:hypothetical protein
MKTDEQIGSEAAKLAHKKILREAKSVRLSTKKVLQRISEGLDAYENKVFYDRQAGKCVYSKKLIAWDVRAKSIDQGIIVLDMKPKENDFENEISATPVRVIREVVDGRKI